MKWEGDKQEQARRPARINFNFPELSGEKQEM